MKKVIAFNISEASQTQSQPTHLDPSFTQTLVVDKDITNAQLDILLKQRTSITSLDLSYCDNLTVLPESIKNLSNLSSLDLSHCDNLTVLPESIENLSNLSSLDLSHCYDLTTLPDSIGNLSNLSSLNLLQCYALKALPKSIGNLSNLSSLNITFCKTLTTLPESIGNLFQLSSLDIAFCTLTPLPELALIKLYKLIREGNLYANQEVITDIIQQCEKLSWSLKSHPYLLTDIKSFLVATILSGKKTIEPTLKDQIMPIKIWWLIFKFLKIQDFEPTHFY